MITFPTDEAQDHFVDTILWASKKDGRKCLSGLLDKIAYLNNYGRDTPTTASLTPGFATGEHSFTVVMQKQDEHGAPERMWVGGLVYHGDGVWGVHT